MHVNYCIRMVDFLLSAEVWMVKIFQTRWIWRTDITGQVFSLKPHRSALKRFCTKIAKA